MGPEGWGSLNTKIHKHRQHWNHAGSHTSSGNRALLSLVASVFADSGVGAGIDSYYEYLMKAYILLGDNVFLDRFNVVSIPCCNIIVSHRLSYYSVWAENTTVIICVSWFFLYSTTVPLWSTSVSLPCCSMYTCTTPQWVCEAGWTLSWHSSLACRS